MKFNKWSSLQSFQEVCKSLNYNRIWATLKDNDFKITYNLKIKLHGTNAAVRIQADGKVVAQKRSSDLVFPNDNAGFRDWVDRNEPYWFTLANHQQHAIVYGEWCGPGVQNNVACSMTPRKVFYVFSIDFFDLDGNFTKRLFDPKLIQDFLGPNLGDDVIVIPYYGQLKMDFEDKNKMAESIYRLNRVVEQIGEEDPFMKELWDIQGAGEGLVCYPVFNDVGYYDKQTLDYFHYFHFKAKSEHHRVNKTKQAVEADPTKLPNRNAFAEMFCTEQRFEQGWVEFMDEGVRTMKDTPKFIEWMNRDVHKESETERAANGLEWKEMSKAVCSRSAMWFKEKVNNQ